MEFLLAALRRLRIPSERRVGFGKLTILVFFLGAFTVFSVVGVLHDRNIISFSGKGGYMYMANIRCPDESPGILDMILQLTLGVTGPLYFAQGDKEAITKAKDRVGSGCRLVTVIKKQPYYRIIHPR